MCENGIFPPKMARGLWRLNFPLPPGINEPTMPETDNIMERVFAEKTHDGGWAVMQARLIREIEALLEIHLNSVPGSAESYEALLRVLSRRTAQAVEDRSSRVVEADTLELIELLTTGDKTIRSFVHDLAEILFLEREERTEYRTNTQVAAPYQIHKLMLEYAVKSRHVDEIIGELTKPYCAASCHKPPVGCCYILGYDLGLVPQTMLRLQAIESRRNGHLPPETEEKCKYHNATGCTLSLFKSPACIGALCDPLMESLQNRYPARDLAAFLRCLEAFRDGHIDRAQLFHAMDGVIRTGRTLLGIDDTRGTDGSPIR